MAKKINPQKSKLGLSEMHVVQGDPMFSKAWSHGIVTKIPDKSTMYFKIPKGQTVKVKTRNSKSQNPKP